MESIWCRREKQEIPERENLSRAARPLAARGRSPRAYLRVHGFVLLQAHRVPEGLAANLARKGSCAARTRARAPEPVCGVENTRGGWGPGRGAAERGRGAHAGRVRAGGAGAGPVKPGAWGASPCCT